MIRDGLRWVLADGGVRVSRRQSPNEVIEAHNDFISAVVAEELGVWGWVSLFSTFYCCGVPTI